MLSVFPQASHKKARSPGDPLSGAMSATMIILRPHARQVGTGEMSILGPFALGD